MNDRLNSKIQEALEMHAAGLEVPAIAEELGVSESTVYHYLGKFKVLAEPAGWEAAEKFMGEIVEEAVAGEPLDKIAKKYETTRYCVVKVLAEQGLTVASSEARRSARDLLEKAVVNAYIGGMRVVKIARQYGIGQAQIYTILERYDIEPNRRMARREPVKD